MNSYLLNLLDEKKMTQAELARRIGRTKAVVFKYTHNLVKQLDLETFCNMSIALDVTVGELLEGIIGEIDWRNYESSNK